VAVHNKKLIPQPDGATYISHNDKFQNHWKDVAHQLARMSHSLDEDVSVSSEKSDEVEVVNTANYH